MSKQGPSGDPQAQGRMRQSQKLRVLTNKEDIRLVLGMPNGAGRRFAWRILTEFSGVFAGSFELDPHLTAFNEGRRSVGIEVMEELQQDHPEQYLQMVHERIANEAIESTDHKSATTVSEDDE